MLIGPNFKPFYRAGPGQGPGRVRPGPPSQWKIGGGTVWGWISYDPELEPHLLRHRQPRPVEPGPAARRQQVDLRHLRPRRRHRRSTLGLSDRARTTCTTTTASTKSILLDLTVNGQQRKVLVRPERNGYVYVMDRLTGEVLSATPFALYQRRPGVDLKTGRLQLRWRRRQPGTGRSCAISARAPPGAKDWQPSAFSPRTGLLYIPHNNLCMDFQGMEANYIAGTPYVGANVRMYAGPGGHRGEFTAWDPVAAKPAGRSRKASRSGAARW